MTSRAGPTNAAEGTVGGGDPQLGTQIGLGLAGGAGLGGPRAEKDTQGPHQDETADEDARPPVACQTAAGLLDRERSECSRDEDGQRQNGDAPGHEPGPFRVAVGELGRHRDVRNLEESERGGGRQEGERYVGTRGGPVVERAGEDGREQDCQGQTGTWQEGAAVAATVGDAAGYRIDQDVPGLGQQDQQSRHTCRDT
jgi:hypothetical protein